MMTAFFGSEPKHILLQQYIINIINNVKTKYYGDMGLDTTGPGCFRKSYDQIKHKLYHKEMILGQFLLRFYPRTFFLNKPKKWVQHKCKECSKNQDWKNVSITLNYGKTEHITVN